MQQDIQTTANGNIQAFANYAEKSIINSNSIKTLKEQIKEMITAQATANEFLPSQAKSLM